MHGNSFASRVATSILFNQNISNYSCDNFNSYFKIIMNHVAKINENKFSNYYKINNLSSSDFQNLFLEL